MEFIEFVIVGVMVLVNGVFAGYEIALASVTVARLQMLVNERRSGAKAALAMKEGIEESLAVVQLGITLVGLIAGATGGASATDDLAPVLMGWGLSRPLANVLAILIVVVPLTALTIVLGELVPKLFALRNKEWVCLRLSPVMRAFSLSVWPVVWLLEASASGLMDLSERFWKPQAHPDARKEAAEIQELRAIVSLARTSRLIGSREENIILGAARLASRPLQEIMIPAESIRMLRVDQSLADNLIAAHLDMHTRFPVTEKADDPQAICGYVTFKDIVAAMKINPRDPSVKGVLRQIMSIPANVPISTALEHLLREHAHIALVRDADKQVVGLVTLEDIVEELLGDIHDEYDLLPNHIVRSGHGWVVGGGATVARLRELTGIDLPASLPTHTLSSWMIEHLKALPEGGEVVQLGTLKALVRKVRRHRVLEAALTVEPGYSDSVIPLSSLAP
jgi:putative hemolysin